MSFENQDFADLDSVVAEDLQGSASDLRKTELVFHYKASIEGAASGREKLERGENLGIAFSREIRDPFKPNLPGRIEEPSLVQVRSIKLLRTETNAARICGPLALKISSGSGNITPNQGPVSVGKDGKHHQYLALFAETMSSPNQVVFSSQFRNEKSAIASAKNQLRVLSKPENQFKAPVTKFGAQTFFVPHENPIAQLAQKGDEFFRLLELHNENVASHEESISSNAETLDQLKTVESINHTAGMPGYMISIEGYDRARQIIEKLVPETPHENVAKDFVMTLVPAGDVTWEDLYADKSLTMEEKRTPFYATARFEVEYSVSD